MWGRGENRRRPMPGVAMREGGGVDDDHCNRFQDAVLEQPSGEGGDREGIEPAGERRAVGEGGWRSRGLRPDRSFEGREGISMRVVGGGRGRRAAGAARDGGVSGRAGRRGGVGGGVVAPFKETAAKFAFRPLGVVFLVESPRRGGGGTVVHVCHAGRREGRRSQAEASEMAAGAEG